MNLNNIEIILVRPEEPRNVGAVCRAMANSGIHRLKIVGKKSEIDAEKVRILAIHAWKIFEDAEFFSSITEATGNCICSAGTTRRRGKKRKGKLLLPEEFAETAGKISDGGKIALVFGNERTGLDDAELLECTMGVTIPSSEEFGSLNLSHAVQILCYTLFRADDKNSVSAGYVPVDEFRLKKTVCSIADDLQEIGFFSLAGRTDMENFWRDILSRASLSEGEAQYIEKIFHKAAGLSKKK
jgi:tRNA/rRNA methyltransferase